MCSGWIDGLNAVAPHITHVLWKELGKLHESEAAGKDTSTPVQPGSTDITITIAVVYLIG